MPALPADKITLLRRVTLDPGRPATDWRAICWMAGAGVRAGYIHGETDDFNDNIVRDPVHVHDLHATMLHLLGVDHTRLTFKFQGRHHRLTDVHGRVIRPLLS